MKMLAALGLILWLAADSRFGLILFSGSLALALMSSGRTA
jgi:hypothetical protein